MSTLEFRCPHISAHEIGSSTFGCLPPTIMWVLCWGRHKNFQDPTILSQDMRTPKFKSGHFYCVTLYIFQNQVHEIKSTILMK